MKFFKLIILLTFSLFACNTNAWDGVNQDGNFVEIDHGNLVRSGHDIDVYVDGEYKNVEVQSIQSFGNDVEVEVYDYNKGNYDTYNMER